MNPLQLIVQLLSRMGGMTAGMTSWPERQAYQRDQSWYMPEARAAPPEEPARGEYMGMLDRENALRRSQRSLPPGEGNTDTGLFGFLRRLLGRY